MKEVSQEQITKLYRFTADHFVQFYDLQTELVDHLANDIEQQWQEDKSIEFEKALKIAFKRFGVFGFDNVVQKRHKAIQKMYWRELWKFSKEYYGLPKIILTLFSVFALYKLFMFLPAPIYAAPIMLLEVFLIVRIYRKINNFEIENHTEKKFIIKENLKGFYMLFMMIFVYSQLNFLLQGWALKILGAEIICGSLAVLTVIFFTIFHALQYELPEFMKRTIESHFPRLKKA